MNGLPKPVYVMSEPHLSGYRVIIGYETLADAQAAQLALSKPPAREDAQPVAVSAKDMAEMTAFANNHGTVEDWAVWCRIRSALTTHPAPDALRAAVTALEAALAAVDEPAPKSLPEQPSRAAEAMAGKADDEARSRWEKRVYAAKNDLVFKVRQALAALQAEQKGGA